MFWSRIALINPSVSALSRSGKKILHVDRDDYYGGPEAAFSLGEAEAWAKKVNEGMTISHRWEDLCLVAFTDFPSSRADDGSSI